MQQNEYISLAQAAQQVPGHPHPSAVWRWCRTGVLSRSGIRVRLEHVRIGGRIFTTQLALDVFFKAVADADASHFDRRVERFAKGDQSAPIVEPTAKRRHNQIEQVKDQLAAAGW